MSEEQYCTQHPAKHGSHGFHDLDDSKRNSWVSYLDRRSAERHQAVSTDVYPVCRRFESSRCPVDFPPDWKKMPSNHPKRIGPHCPRLSHQPESFYERHPSTVNVRLH